MPAPLGGDFDPTTAVTPYRLTTATFDYSEQVQIGAPYYFRRVADQIAEKEARGHTATDKVIRLASGAWALEPIQDRISNLAELNDSQGAIITLSAANFENVGYMAARARYRKTDATQTNADSGASGSLLASGDSFITKKLGAAVSWATELLSGEPKPSYPNTSYPMRRALIGKVTYPFDQGFLLRFRVPGTQQQSQAGILGFYFGGALRPEGYGRYCLFLQGDGYAALYEGVSGAWEKRDEWQWCPPQAVAGRAHAIRIIPHGGKFIEFRTQTTHKTQRALGPLSRWLPSTTDMGAETHLYAANEQKTGVKPGANVTGPGGIAFDIRQDLTPELQVSLLRYPTTGGRLTDQPTAVPWNTLVTNPIVGAMQSFVPAGCGIGMAGYDSATAAALASPAAQQWTLPSPPIVHFSFSFTSDGTKTPLLWGYELRRDGYTGTSAPGEFGLQNARCEAWTILGPDADPSHESAGMSVSDLGNQLTVLQQRAFSPVRIETQYSATDTTLKSVLFEGYVTRCETRRRGIPRAPMSGEVMTWPSPSWRELEIECAGKWARLKEQYLGGFGQLDFSRDTAAPQDARGNYPPWKVTDALRTLLSYCGFPSTQIDVPDNSLRLWISTTEGDQMASIWKPTPYDNVADFAQTLARNYLGAYLLWDPNANSGSTRGMWRLRYQPTAGTSFYTFTLDTPAAGRYATWPNSYAAATTFIQKDTFRRWVVPPEFNALLVVGSGDIRGGESRANWAWWLNYQSFQVPGQAAPSAVNNPHYIGWMKPVILLDNTINTQEAANWIARRLASTAGQPKKMAAWESPLVLVNDPSDTYLGSRYRPLRYGDTVTVDGQTALVRSVAPSWSKDVAQMAAYEAELQ